MLSARSALKAEYGRLHKAVLAILRDDAVCRRLMTVPGVGPLVAVTYKSAIDDPRGIVNSQAAGALFGLTPKKLPIRRKRCQGRIHAGRRRDSAHGVFMRRQRPAVTHHAVLKTQAVGDGCRHAARLKARKGRPGTQARSDPASDLDRRWTDAGPIAA